MQQKIEEINQLQESIAEDQQNKRQNKIESLGDDMPNIIIHEIDSNASIKGDNISNKTIQIESTEKQIPLNQQEIGKYQKTKIDQQEQNNYFGIDIRVLEVKSIQSIQGSKDNAEVINEKSQIKQQTKSQYKSQFDQFQEPKSQRVEKTEQSTQKNTQASKQEKRQYNSVTNTNRSMFKIKKGKDQRTSYNDNVKNNSKVTKSLLRQQISQIIQSKNNQQSFQGIKFKKGLNKNNSSIYVRQSQKQHKRIKTKNVQKQNSEAMTYQVQIDTGNIEMMSQILEDRNYYQYKKNKGTSNQHSSPSQEQGDSTLIRKIIKRSPYGLLQIELKDQNQYKKAPKITNLRILKPKQASKLHKVSKIKKVLEQHETVKMDFKLSYKGIDNPKKYQNKLPEIIR